MPRVNFSVGVQCSLAALLLVYTLWMQFSRARSSLGRASRAWARNLAMYAVIVLVLEFFWPSRFDPWWMP